eukprot:Skav203290  [mRNA]  locus=scaffold5484:10349:13665:+ [translate_table: standard]
MSSTRPKWFGPTFTANYKPEEGMEWNNMKLREIKHCRLAMVGFFFMVLTNASTGQGPSLIPNFTQAEFQSTVGHSPAAGAAVLWGCCAMSYHSHDDD